MKFKVIFFLSTLISVHLLLYFLFPTFFDYSTILQSPDKSSEQQQQSTIKPAKANAKSEIKDIKKDNHIPFSPVSNWAPLVWSTCEHWMPTYYAPCMRQRSNPLAFVAADELIYPDFEIVLPNFDTEADKSLWLSKLDEGRMRVLGNWASYFAQNGQNLVLRNGKWRGQPRSGWQRGHCMDHTSSHVQLVSDTFQEDEVNNEVAIVASSPDNWSFQHFLDRVTHILLQGLISIPTVDPAQIKIITDSYKLQDAVGEIYEMIGFTKNNVVGGIDDAVGKLVFSCRAPLIHPFFAHLTMEKLGINHNISIDERDTVVLFSRSGKNVLNGGRNIVNENELVVGIEHLLQLRGQNEVLTLFTGDNFQHVQDTIQFFNKRVKAMIGVSGGAFYNLKWAAVDTLVVEYMPSKHMFTGFWEESSLLDHNYWVVYSESLNPSHDIKVDVDQLLSILEANLGRKNPQGSTIRRPYSWDKKEAGTPIQ